jgi:chemotaxis protein methyltransferase CheR
VDARELAQLQQLLEREAGIVLDAAHAYAVEARLLELAHAEHQPGTAALLAAAVRGRDPDLLRRVCEAATVHETRFFRDEKVFQALAGVVIPELLRRGRRELRIWCGAVASGQEAYSVSMLLADYFPTLRARIVATDLSRTMIERARRGDYSEFELSRGLSVPQRARHVVRTSTGWEIRPELRERVEFLPLNLAGTWPVWQPFDLVLLRNVLVYFAPNVRAQVLERARGILAHDGVLVLGATETLPARCAGFARRQIADATFFHVTTQESSS